MSSLYSLGDAQPSQKFIQTVKKLKALLDEAGVKSFVFVARDPDSDCEANLHQGAMTWRLGAVKLIEADILEMGRRSGKIGGPPQ